MKLPFLKYIQSLIVVKKYTSEQVLEKIKALDVALAKDFPEEALKAVYQHLMKSNPKHFQPDITEPDIEWLRELDIEKLVCYELNLKSSTGIAGIPGALEMIKDINMYDTITSLAIAKIDDLDIELIVSGKFNIHYTADDIREFLHYFFNIDGWTLSEKKEYVSLVKIEALKKHYELALDGDKDYLIWKLGIAPDKSFDEMLRDMATDSYYNFKEMQKKNADVAQRWAGLSIKLSERVDKMEKEAEDRKTIFESLEFILSGVDPTKDAVLDKDGQVIYKKKIRHIREIENE